MSKSRYDRRPVNQYGLVPSQLGIKGDPSDIRSTLKRNFLLPLEGLHVKRAMQRGIWVPTQQMLHMQEYIKAKIVVAIGRAACEACGATWNLGTNSAFALGPRKTTENLAGRKTFRIQTDF
jgi:hypothetical protein